MDRRDRNHQWYRRFDESNMVLVIENDEGEEVELPAKFEVCGTCDGKGSHVNPSIDSHGLTAEDFAEDPDFRENYFSGMYDQPCNECHGLRVVPVVDEERVTAEQKRMAEEWQESHYQDQLCREAEMRWGY